VSDEEKPKDLPAETKQPEVVKFTDKRGKTVEVPAARQEQLLRDGFQVQSEREANATERKRLGLEGSEYQQYLEFKKEIASDTPRARAIRAAIRDPESVLARGTGSAAGEREEPDDDTGGDKGKPVKRDPKLATLEAEVARLKRSEEERSVMGEQERLTKAIDRELSTYDGMSAPQKRLVEKQIAVAIAGNPEALRDIPGLVVDAVNEIRTALVADASGRSARQAERNALLTESPRFGVPTVTERAKHTKADLAKGKVFSDALADVLRIQEETRAGRG